jgi:ABC-2 type transport system ATP-binding protein
VLVHEPQVLILDEPTNGVDPVSRQEFWDMLLEMRAGGMTIVVSTAYLDEGEKCDRLGLMHNGGMLAIATPGEMKDRYPSLEEAIVQRIQNEDRELVHDTFK